MNPTESRDKQGGVPDAHQIWWHPPLIWIAILLVGAFLRWAALEPMSRLLNYDEAYYAADALSVMRHFHLTPFFPANEGREAGWIYLIALVMSFAGTNYFTLRVVATLIGILTLAAVYCLGREIMGRTGALWAMAVLAVFYWHVHHSQLALRAILYPLIGTLAFAALLRAQRTNQRHWWLASGVLFGLLTYTYLAARLWIGYGAVLLLGWALREPIKRRFALTALLITTCMSVPLIAYSYLNPLDSMTRLQQVGVFNSEQILHNSLAWLNAWFQVGDNNPEFNVPGRPILDPYLGSLFLIGLVALPWITKKKWQAVWLVGLAGISIAPSLFSIDAPHFLRAIGLTIPIALIAGGGAMRLESGLRKLINHPLVVLAPVTLLALTGLTTYFDFQQRWLVDPRVHVSMNGAVMDAITYVRTAMPGPEPVYFSPFSPSDPNLFFESVELAPHPIGSFNGHFCMVMRETPAVYASVTENEPGFEQTLTRWATVRVLHEGAPSLSEYPEYSVFEATPRAQVLAALRAPALAVFDDMLEIRVLGSFSATVRPGDTLDFALALRSSRPLPYKYSIFAHLYDTLTPDANLRPWAQGDSQVCGVETLEATWTPDEIIVQQFVLPLPADLPPGAYRVAVGVYESSSLVRLQITQPSMPTPDYLILGSVQVAPGP